MLVEWGGDGLVATDNFMTARTNGVATYRNSDFFGLVDGLKSHCNTRVKIITAIV
jgi:outer membrane pore protein F